MSKELDYVRASCTKFAADTFEKALKHFGQGPVGGSTKEYITALSIASKGSRYGMSPMQRNYFENLCVKLDKQMKPQKAKPHVVLGPQTTYNRATVKVKSFKTGRFGLSVIAEHVDGYTLMGSMPSILEDSMGLKVTANDVNVGDVLHLSINVTKVSDNDPSFGFFTLLKKEPHKLVNDPEEADIAWNEKRIYAEIDRAELRASGVPCNESSPPWGEN